jgi:hypothetical protein
VKARFPIALAVAVFLALMAPCVWAQDGLEGVLPRVVFASRLNPDALFKQSLAVGDFDNDQKPDGALLLQSGKTAAGRSSFRIELHLSGSANTAFTFESNETTLAIIAVDINKDGATDLVVEQPFTHKPLYVWLGDGHGGFHQGRIDDFSSYSTLSNQFDTPAPKTDGLAICPAPQRGTYTSKLTVHVFAGPPPQSRDFEAGSVSSSPASPSFSLRSSRAPPTSILG